MSWRGRRQDPAEAAAADKALAQFKEPRPTDDEVRAMPLEELRERFKRGAFGIVTTWDEVLRIREGK